MKACRVSDGLVGCSIGEDGSLQVCQAEPARVQRPFTDVQCSSVAALASVSWPAGLRAVTAVVVLAEEREQMALLQWQGESFRAVVKMKLPRPGLVWLADGPRVWLLAEDGRLWCSWPDEESGEWHQAGASLPTNVRIVGTQGEALLLVGASELSLPLSSSSSRPRVAPGMASSVVSALREAQNDDVSSWRLTAVCANSSGLQKLDSALWDWAHEKASLITAASSDGSVVVGDGWLSTRGGETAPLPAGVPISVERINASSSSSWMAVGRDWVATEKGSWSLKEMSESAVMMRGGRLVAVDGEGMTRLLMHEGNNSSEADEALRRGLEDRVRAGADHASRLKQQIREKTQLQESIVAQWGNAGAESLIQQSGGGGESWKVECADGGRVVAWGGSHLTSVQHRGVVRIDGLDESRPLVGLARVQNNEDGSQTLAVLGYAYPPVQTLPAIEHCSLQPEENLDDLRKALLHEIDTCLGVDARDIRLVLAAQIETDRLASDALMN